MSVVVHTTEWTCAAECCGNTLHTRFYVESLFAAMDPRTERRRPSPPLGWVVVDGRSYCELHEISRITVISTPGKSEQVIKERIAS